MNDLKNLPGMESVEGREFRYLEWESAESFRDLFPLISSAGDEALPSHGGIMNEEAMIVLPTGEKFFGVSFRGDLAGWDQKVTACADASNVRSGRIVDQMLVLSDGTKVPLTTCLVQVTDQ